MAKDPAALFYIDHWLVATAEMRADCRGWYVNLVLHQFKSGSLPDDMEELANLANVRFSEYAMFQQVWQQVLKHKFKVLPTGRLQDVEAAEIVQAREEFKEKRAAAGRMSAFIKLIRKDLCQDENVLMYVKKNVNPEHIITSDQHVLKQVFNHLFQLYINKDKIINKNRKEDGIGGTGEKETEGEGAEAPPADLPESEPDDPPPENWNAHPGKSERSLELPKVKADCALELLLINGATAQSHHVEKLWEVFKNQHFNGEKFYYSPNDAYNHFINWAKTQKINGNKTNSSNSVARTGTSTAQIRSLEHLRATVLGGANRPSD
jgi:hypothetical protein